MVLNIYQQVFGLNASANYLAKKTNETLEKMQAEIEEALPKVIATFGSWTVVWGPVVWQAQTGLATPSGPPPLSEGPDNVWYVAYNATTNAYVVAIAGTAKYSKYDQKHEDGDVHNVVDLSEWLSTGLTGAFTTHTKLSRADDAKNTYISQGTAEGIHALLNNKSPQTAQAPGTLLGDFLATIPATSTLIFTGHSLGGALSPTLALAWWKSTMPKNVPLANVKTYPTAGATPGNANFVAEFEAAFPSPANPTGYQNWNVNLANTLDAVPQAWCTSSAAAPSQNLHRLPEFYDGTPACQAEVFILIIIMASRAKKSGLGYRPIKTSFFTGSSAALPVQKPKRLTDLSDPDIWDPKEPCWLNDAHFAHTSQY
ncbi:hypothetical protein FRB95_011186 [Tulasnella sp. JGI-2019a]|nr:hypothetical protein FRB95_011186 [Tulasnella sp. JGI-2019a]